jgi:hypothetical protein
LAAGPLGAIALTLVRGDARAEHDERARQADDRWQRRSDARRSPAVRQTA